METSVSSRELKEFIEKMQEFFEERDWLQFHSPKNMAIDLVCEASEVAEHFRWVTEEKSYHLDEKTHSEVKDEIGDTMIALLHLAHQLKIDPLQAAEDKLVKIGERYPADRCRGRCDKYTEYE